MVKKYSIITSFLLHLHPKKVNEQALKYTRTFGLGGINVLLFFILALTGLLIRFWYIPIPEEAYNSIISLQSNSLFGSLLRNVHHWAAMLMVITAFLHLLRVFYSTSIYHERRKNWYYGLILFVTVLAFNFTGYLLPWDQLSYWAVTIMTNIVEYLPFVGRGLANILRGGEFVNANTLLNFYNFHTAILPLIFVVFMLLHFWLIRKAKGVTIANVNDQKMVDVNPQLISKEIVVALFVIASILVFSIFIDAPLLEKANPMLSPNPSKAPWYFMGLQELLVNLHPILASLFTPLLLATYLFIIPKININKEKVGVWFYSAKGKKIVLLSSVFSVVLTLSIIIILEHVLHLNYLDIPLFISTGVIPFSMYLLPFIAFILYQRTILKADKLEIVVSITTIIFTSYIVMSIVGIYFRGEGMRLIF